jgi:hypothetical protein
MSAQATRPSRFPPGRRGGPAFDFLGDDLSVVSKVDRVLLTNVTGHFIHDGASAEFSRARMF